MSDNFQGRKSIEDDLFSPCYCCSPFSLDNHFFTRFIFHVSVERHLITLYMTIKNQPGFIYWPKKTGYNIIIFCAVDRQGNARIIFFISANEIVGNSPAKDFVAC